MWANLGQSRTKLEPTWSRFRLRQLVPGGPRRCLPKGLRADTSSREMTVDHWVTFWLLWAPDPLHVGQLGAK
eukprot:287657-Karenia_brevis.AAC.1